MEEIEIKEKADEGKIELLKRVMGCKTEEAKPLLFLIKNKEGKSKDIERAMRVKQPSVSVGMRQLEKDGIVKVKVCLNGKKGRPENLYRIGLSKNEMLAVIEEKASARIKEIQENIKQMKQLKQIF